MSNSQQKYLSTGTAIRALFGVGGKPEKLPTRSYPHYSIKTLKGKWLETDISFDEVQKRLAAAGQEPADERKLWYGVEIKGQDIEIRDAWFGLAAPTVHADD
jgi:hypothetical protein